MTLYLFLFMWWFASGNGHRENTNTTELFNHLQETLPRSQREGLDFVLSL